MFSIEQNTIKSICRLIRYSYNLNSIFNLTQYLRSYKINFVTSIA